MDYLRTSPPKVNTYQAYSPKSALAIFTLEIAVAANAEKLSVVSVSSNIVYMNAVRGSKLIAEAQCLKSGRKNCFFRIVVTDELGSLVAEITETGCRVEGC